VDISAYVEKIIIFKYLLNIFICIMELKEFIENFAEAIEFEDVAALSGSTEFKELDEWSSLGALDVIAMVDEEYDVTIAGKDIRGVRTLEELFNLVKDKA